MVGFTASLWDVGAAQTGGGCIELLHSTPHTAHQGVMMQDTISGLLRGRSAMYYTALQNPTAAATTAPHQQEGV